MFATPRLHILSVGLPKIGYLASLRRNCSTSSLFRSDIAPETCGPRAASPASRESADRDRATAPSASACRCAIFGPRHVERVQQLGQPIGAEKRLLRIRRETAHHRTADTGKYSLGCSLPHAPAQLGHVANQARKTFARSSASRSHSKYLSPASVLFRIQRKACICHLAPLAQRNLKLFVPKSTCAGSGRPEKRHQTANQD